MWKLVGVLALLWATQAHAALDTWNPNDKTAGWTLSNGNLTSVPASSWSGVRSIQNRTAGKYYVEFTITTVSASDMGIGLANSSYTLSFASGPGFDTAPGNSWATYPDGTSWIGGANTGSGLTFANGNVVGIAIDIDNKKTWTRIGSGNWNNAVIGSQNPATNTGGYSFSGMTGPYYLLYADSINTDQNTVNMGKTAFANTPPANFVPWSGGTCGPRQMIKVTFANKVC